VNDVGATKVASDVREASQPITRGAILYDASLADHADESWFDADRWHDRGSVERQTGGRGAVAFLQDDERRWVLRHYRRGGAVARVLDDRYLYTGADRTRGFREWRLLRELALLGLPAPRPIAARYRRHGPFYRADLLTAELPSRTTLAQTLASSSLPMGRWSDIGRCIGQFHAHGVRHADLNAHNVVLGATGEIYLLDFDRGRIVKRGAWEEAVLARLERSLVKVTQGLPAGRYGPEQWQRLLDACRRV
jgi:3-deoxy-D-manno-octulosonic acid kinase